MTKTKIIIEKTQRGVIIFFKDINKNYILQLTRDELKEFAQQINEKLQ